MPTRRRDAFLLWPPPQRVTLTGESVMIPRDISASCALKETPALKKAWLVLRNQGEARTDEPHFEQDPKAAWIRISPDASLPEEGYRLVIERLGVRVEAATPVGATHALNTLHSLLRQLSHQQHHHVPCLLIEDWPDFPVRGFMLDISRGKVPQNLLLGRLMFHLAELKYNQVQLYTEHTYAFAKHKQVWRDASPLTKADVLQAQRWASNLGLELTPNFNSFGHFERWLKHPKYKHLAECPKGFTHPIKGRVPHGTTLRPDAPSLKFLDKLWAEYLPLFKSTRFNLGGDEPWELGQGWSKPLVKKHGKQRVYLDFLKKLHQLAAKHGKKMLFWGDILLEAPELVKEVPLDATALLWGYEADHPFAEQCAQMAKAGRKFWVCPGTSAWNTFTGRTDNMLANLESAAKHGLANGAEGLLLTSWGDGGNHQPWPVMYPAIAYAAGLAWNQKGTRRSDLGRAVDLIFNNKNEGLGDTLLELGRVEKMVSKPKPNRSRHHGLFFATRAELAKEFKTLSASELKALATRLAQLRKALSEPAIKQALGTLPRQELSLGVDMATWAVQRSQLSRAKKSTGLMALELNLVIRRFETIWIKRARPGGLTEATTRMRAIVADL